jgi:hypothetical protein
MPTLAMPLCQCKAAAVDFLVLSCRGERVVGPGSLEIFIVSQFIIVKISDIIIHLVYLLTTISFLYLFDLSATWGRLYCYSLRTTDFI